VINQLVPDTAAAGGQAFTITLNGSGFSFASVVRWNGQDRQTSFLSASQLTAQITAADIATASTANVTVFSPTPGGGVTAPSSFTVGTAAVATSAASYAAVIAPDSIVAVFGTGMATGVALGATIPLPTTLLGTTVMVRDSLGVSRPAPLFFVAPTQINILVPKDTAPGAAMLFIRAGDGKVSVATPIVDAVQPALFSVDATGTGMPAAIALRLKADGAVLFESIYRIEGGQVVPIPIDLGPTGESVFIVAYGTGIRGKDTNTNGSATLGGLNFPVLAAGAQPEFVGLDQINLGPIPRALAGRGAVSLIYRLNNKDSNTVTVTIK
jgi:uncharacterized protein (TIGR03437 family)